MNTITPIEPEKARDRFQAVGLRPDPSEPAQWYVVDLDAPLDLETTAMFGDPEDPATVLGTEVADCGAGKRSEADATRIAYALNVVGRLLGDPGEPYMIDDVERLGDALGKVAAQSTSRSIQAMRMGETETGLMFGAEARAVGAGSAMLGRLLAEVLKFMLIGETLDELAESWLERAYPQLHSGTWDTLTAGQYVANLLDAYRKGAVAGMTRGLKLDTGEEVDPAVIGGRLVELARTSSHAAAVLGLVTAADHG